ncbi:SpoU rRNA Methylase-like protein 2 [Elsinoe fawcettii]|nr:SpoU rRNA Methylase-like protein 2 [Elsinoe fawcettii]
MQDLPPQDGLDRLVARIPARDQATALEDIASSLNSKNDLAVARWILARQPISGDSSAHDAVFSFLEALYREQPDVIVAFCLDLQTTIQWISQKVVSDIARTLDELDDVEKAATHALSDPEGDLRTVMQRKKAAHEGVILYLCLGEQIITSKVERREGPLNANLLDVLFRALSNASSDLSNLARLSILRLLETMSQTPADKSSLSDMQRRLWDWIQRHDKSARGTHHASAFVLWWHLLIISSNAGPNDHFLGLLFSSDGPWGTLQEALLLGDTEVRRNVLRILRKSMDVLATSDITVKNVYLSVDKSNKVMVKRKVDRFCTVFETIIMGRYINQIRELEADLTNLGDDLETLPQSWILTLLQSAMSDKMQDSIRTFIGGWILASKLAPSGNNDKMKVLVTESVLPWATRGATFINTIRGTRDGIFSDHGKKLSNFISGLLDANAPPNPTPGQVLLFESIIMYLDETRYNTMPFAIAHILYGLQQALASWSQQDVSEGTISALADIVATPGFPEIPRDLIIVLCDDISRRVSAPILSREVAGKTQALQTRRRALLDSDPSKQTFPVVWTSLDTLEESIRNSRCDCLKGKGLMDACDSVAAIYQGNTAQVLPNTLATVLDSIWEQVEIQDYPKAVLLKLPTLYLHPHVITVAGQKADLKDQIIFFMSEYQKLITGRIYCWAPFMLSIRRAVLSAPEFVGFGKIIDIVHRIVRSPPIPKPEFLVDAAAASLLSTFSSTTSHLTYEHYFGVNEAVGWAAYFDLIAYLDSADPALSARLLDDLLEPWVKQRVPAVIVCKWKNTEWLQTILILMEGQYTSSNAEMAERYARDVMYLLSIEPLPRYRFLCEWILCRLIVRHKQVMRLIIDVLSSIDHHGNPKYLASIVKVAAGVICSTMGDQSMAARVIPRLTGLAASSKIIIRHEAQWALPAFWRHAETQGWKQITENTVVAGLMDYIHSLERTIVPAAERENSRFALDTDHTMGTLLCGSYLGLEPSTVPRLEMDHYDQLLELEKQAGTSPHASLRRCMPLGSQPRARVEALYRDALKEKKPTPTDDLIALQTKGTSYLSGTIGDIRTKRHNSTLLVVGSLVDNPYNVGGLSRVAEIFGAAALYVSNTKVLTHKDFESVAVSSHMHFDVRDLPVSEMVQFFSQKRAEGFCIVGIEQTDRSRTLGEVDTILPQKTVLVLGAEKEGMPAEILAVCDLLVEIPQKGSTRSLNVQTAAACVLFDYCRQHK